jgi:hypothetical protein
MIHLDSNIHHGKAAVSQTEQGRSNRQGKPAAAVIPLGRMFLQCIALLRLCRKHVHQDTALELDWQSVQCFVLMTSKQSY